MIVTQLDQTRRWKWGYYEPKFFRVQGDRVVVARPPAEPYDISLQFAEAFAADDTIYRDVFLVTCRVSRDICERILDVARSLWVSEPPPHITDVVKALTLVKLA
jgi:hypothetical protein